MILRVPDYYNTFKCIGSACKHNCCIGWGVDIDDVSAEGYRAAEGEFGERLRSSMTVEDGYDTFIMNGERCPFLNDNNLCDIFINMGEESLCNVCTEYPRFGEQYGSLLEKGLGLSCEEAGRIILSHKERVGFIDTEIDLEPEETDEVMLTALVRSRAVIIDILQDRTRSIEERIAMSLAYAQEVQEHINMNDPERVSTERKEYIMPQHMPDYTSAMELLSFFAELDPMEDNWSEIVNKTIESVKNAGQYVKKLAALKNSCEEYMAEQMAVYFIYRYYLKAMYDNDAYSKVRFMSLCFIVLRVMAAAQTEFGLSAFVETARCFSANIEHSQVNLEAIEDELMFNEKLSLKGIINML